MEIGRADVSMDRDLRNENEEFCRMWGCRSFKIGYSCHWCPILTDLQRMAVAFKVNFQNAETVAENCLNVRANPVSALLK